VLAGVAAVGLPLLAWFAWHGAADDAFRALVLHPFGGFLGQHDIAYLPLGEILGRDRMADLGRLTYGAWAFNSSSLVYDSDSIQVRCVEILHVLLYWTPPALIVVAAVWSLARVVRGRSLDAGLASVVAVSGFVFLGVFPRADYNHLINVYQPVLVTVAIVLHRLVHSPGERWRRTRRLAIGASGALLLAYAGVAGFWWLEILSTFDNRIPQPRAGVLVNKAEMQMIDFEVKAIQDRTEPGEAVLTVPGFAMLNFLAERPMPSRYYNLYAVHIGHDQGEGVVEGAEASAVKLVVADYHDFFSEHIALREYAPKLVSYLRRNFEPIFAVAIDQHLFMERRSEPLPERLTVNVLEDCDASPSGTLRRDLQEHLLFESLYHYLSSRAGEEIRQVITLCRVTVPPGATLAFSVGYRQPVKVLPDARLEAEVWVHRLEDPSADNRVVFRELLELIAVGGWGSPPPVPSRVDLSDYAGEEVLLAFRTLFDGEVRMNPFDIKGFAMIWEDPQIEFEESAR
jgi:hypothetical protein